MDSLFGCYLILFDDFSFLVLQSAVFEILSAVLHLGNVEFVEFQDTSVRVVWWVCEYPRRF